MELKSSILLDDTQKEGVGILHKLNGQLKLVDILREHIGALESHIDPILAPDQAITAGKIEADHITTGERTLSGVEEELDQLFRATNNAIARLENISRRVRL